MFRIVAFSLKGWSAVYQLFTFLLFLILPLRGSEENLIFKRLTSKEGLSQNTVFCIFQDRKGFIWFGTNDRLNRYDGYSFTIYLHGPFDSTLLSANYITEMLEDSPGFLWNSGSG